MLAVHLVVRHREAVKVESSQSRTGRSRFMVLFGSGLKAYACLKENSKVFSLHKRIRPGEGVRESDSDEARAGVRCHRSAGAGRKYQISSVR